MARRNAVSWSLIFLAMGIFSCVAVDATREGIQGRALIDRRLGLDHGIKNWRGEEAAASRGLTADGYRGYGSGAGGGFGGDNGGGKGYGGNGSGFHNGGAFGNGGGFHNGGGFGNGSGGDGGFGAGTGLGYGGGVGVGSGVYGHDEKMI